ncbi:MAG: tRNA 2-thiouridine(34) synthase MnmA [Candidatus Sungbacteria bacterium]|nr:tRNA 2-thiouridine(34) synthase MnmA [Candidatus Sungbacteria bacterium]
MKSQERKNVFVAMSGGVDSSVAAMLLKKRGFEVRGIHMKMWSDPDIPCTSQEDRLDAARVAAHLGIPFETWDFTQEYKKWVVDYMVQEYATGRIPNPDVMCNRHIKFGLFLKRALKEGADFIATGHYVRLSARTKSLELRTKKNLMLSSKSYILSSAADAAKDQSYFLWTLAQDQLKHCLFPIGEYTKPAVREMARKFGLPVAEKPDSQGVCFIGEFDMKEFLKKRIPESRGPVVTTSGKKVGEHEGLSFYTIGQRHGMGIGGRPAERGEPRPKGAGGIPYYVVAKDFKTDTLIVGEGPYDEKLFKKELIATNVNWIFGKEPKLPLKCEARIRYRQPLQRCRVEANKELRTKNLERKLSSKFYMLNACRVKVIFDAVQRAVTPGQSVVFYQGDEMLGGGIIYPVRDAE